MHAEALGGGVTQFDAAVEAGACPFLNQLGEAALGEVRAVYEQVEAGNFEALGELAERLASAVEQKNAPEAPGPVESPAAAPAEQFVKTTSEPVEEVKAETKIDEVLSAGVSVVPDTASPVEPASKIVVEAAVTETVFTAVETSPAPRTTVEPVAIIDSQIPAMPLDLRTEVPAMPVVAYKEPAVPHELPIPEVVVVAKADAALAPPDVAMGVVVREPAEAEVLPVVPSHDMPVEAALGSVVGAAETEETNFRTDDLLILIDEKIVEQPASRDTSSFPEALTYSDEELLQVYESELVETYRELEALVADIDKSDLEMSIEAVATDVEAAEWLTADEVVVVPDYVPPDLIIADKALAVPDFRTFVAEQPAPQEPVTFQAIQEQAAEEQPLEQVLAQVAVLLSERDAPETSGDEEQLIAVAATLQEIADILPTCYILEETDSPKVRITPEMTKNLLNLLENLGYEKPREVLVQFVSDNGLVFLFEAVDHLSSLTSDEYNPEFAVPMPFLWSASDDEYPKLRLRRALFDLVARAPSRVPTLVSA